MKTFFRPEMNVKGNNSSSPSAGKPKKFIEYLLKHKLPLELVENFEPLARSDFYLAHDEAIVNGILDLAIPNGFGNKLEEVARSLPFTSGSFYAAAEYAVKNHANTFSPTSGFHHASFDSPGGFCTFNGIAVTALKLKNEGLVEKIGIVDCDQHYGNGTEDIIQLFELNWINHYTFGNEGIRPTNAERWLIDFERELKEFKDNEIIFYQAGADPHVDDPLGGNLTTSQMKKRDEIVFSTFQRLGVPVVWNLAGGYQKPLDIVLDLHKTTYEIALKHS